MKLTPYTRITRTYSDIKNNTYTILNNFHGSEIVLDDYAFYILMSILKKDGYIKIPFFAKRRLANFVNDLKNNGIITDKEVNGPYYLNFSSDLEYPLTNITLELTNYCNLKCIHCYGKYGMPKEIIQMKFEDYLRIKSDFDKLNVKGIALTGGECTLNDDFIKISTDILNSGYNLCILTNGYNYSILKKLVTEKTQFNFVIKVSLDGVKDTHNFIRGNDNSYNNAIIFLDFLKEFDNITVYISTVLMKYNEDGYCEFRNFIKNRYPNFIHTTDIVFPSGNAINNDECYNQRDLINLAEKIPYLFMAKKKDGDSKIRCTGGFSQCSIEPNGEMKICNAATDKRFKFKHNCFKVGLKRAWEDCGQNIITFRNEKPKLNKECSSCKFNSTCTTTNCRLLAYFYNGSELTNSPLTCILEGNKCKNKMKRLT